MFSDNFALNDVDIHGPDGGAILFVASAKKDAINISCHMDRQWIGGVRDKLWMLATFPRNIKLA